jgi:hypothetical protein
MATPWPEQTIQELVYLGDVQYDRSISIDEMR